MASVILLENGADGKSLGELASTMQASGDNVIVVASSAAAAESPSVFWLQSEDAMSARALQRAIELSQGQRVSIIDARMTLPADELKALAASLTSSAAGTFAFASIDGDSAETANLDGESLLQLLTNNAGWPTAAVSFDRSLLSDIEADTAAEMIVRAMIKAAAQDMTMTRVPSMALSADEQALFTLSDAALGRCLNAAIDAFNIEELFPQHAWDAHQQESAAASYHTLAALFIRLGDSSSAMECLSFSDTLEDSPRSLALKGLIALDKGETLGAVANMVSSLQQYEIRKNSSTHYLTFAPKDLEAINDNLKSGLSALNKHDNETALQHFATAVFNFDSFYSECGVDSLKQ